MAPIIFFAIFLFFVVMLSYFMISATTEEKENRVAEILLTTIKSRSLIIGKILSILVLGIVQIVIIIVPLMIGLCSVPQPHQLTGRRIVKPYSSCRKSHNYRGIGFITRSSYVYWHTSGFWLSVPQCPRS